MARHLKSANSGSPVNLAANRHAFATAGQARLIRLGRAANDNHAPHRRWLMIIGTAAAIALAALIVSML